MQEILTVFTNMGSSIACLVACMWYIVKKDASFAAERKSWEEERKRISDSHSEEAKATVEAVNSLTVVISELKTWLQKGESNG